MSNCGNADYAAETWNTRTGSAELTATNARIAEMKAENKALRSALEPFVNLSEWAPVYEMITVNDMRQAAALLKDKSK